MSWATFLLLCLEPTLGKELPAWLNHLSSLSINNDFITLLWQSELWVGWDQVGLLFNNSCQYPHHAKVFMKARVPMWLLWGKHKPSEWPNSLFIYLQPTNQEINIAHKKTLMPHNPKTPCPSSSFTSTWGMSLTTPSSANSWDDSAWGKVTGGSWGLAECYQLCGVHHQLHLLHPTCGVIQLGVKQQEGAGAYRVFIIIISYMGYIIDHTFFIQLGGQFSLG